MPNRQRVTPSPLPPRAEKKTSHPEHKILDQEIENASHAIRCSSISKEGHLARKERVLCVPRMEQHLESSLWNRGGLKREFPKKKYYFAAL